MFRAVQFGLLNAWRPLDPHQGSWRGHSRLSQGSWRGVDLKELVRQEFEPFAKAASALTDGPTIVLPPDIAQAVSPTLHELATNAAKFGALSQAPGQLSVRWTCEAVGIPEGRLVIDWRESGGPEVMPAARASYGSSPIRELICHEVPGSSVEFDFAPSGVTCRMVMPLARITRRRVRQGRLPAILFKRCTGRTAPQVSDSHPGGQSLLMPLSVFAFTQSRARIPPRPAPTPWCTAVCA